MLLGNTGSKFAGRERRVKKRSTSNSVELPGGDLQGLHVMGTERAVIAVGDAVCPTDLAQDEGAGCDGFAGFGVAQVCAAVNLGR